MPALDPALAFALTALIVELTPGPNMAWLAILSATEGRRHGFAAVAGVAIGLALVGIAAAAGLAGLMRASPAAYQALRWAGFAYLLFLAFQAWKGAQDHESGDPGQTAWRYFWQGIVTNVLNPKAAVFYLAVLPEFLPAEASGAQVAGFSAIYVAVATLVHAGLVIAAGTASSALTDPQRLSLARRIMALALCLVAIWLFWRG